MRKPPSVGGARRVLGKSVAFGQHVGAVPPDYLHRGKRREQEPLPRYQRPLGRARRGGIHYLYDGPLGRPEESGRDGEGGTVPIISALLFIPSGSAADVRKVLTDCQRARLALDSHEFADLDAAVAFQCALASAGTSAAGAALRAKWNMGERGRAVGAHGDDLDGGGAIERAVH